MGFDDVCLGFICLVYVCVMWMSIRSITVEDPPDATAGSGLTKVNAMVPVHTPARGMVAGGNPSSARNSLEGGPMSVALDGPNPSPHFVSLENIARLYLEMKGERDHLVRESSKIFNERVQVVSELRELEVQLNELLQRKSHLEDCLDRLGVRDEENRTQMAIVDEKVSSIASESQRFEATVRELKGVSHSGAISVAGGGESRVGQVSSAVSPRPKPSPACKRTMYGHTGNILGLDVCRSSNVIISASSDRSLRTWDAAGGRRLDTLYGHDGWVHAVAFSSAGQRAVSGSGDKTVKVWDLGDARGRGTCSTTIKGHAAGVTCVQLDDDDVLVSGSLDKTLRRYDLREGSSEAFKVIQGHEQGVYCLQFVRHGLASGGGDSLIRMHDMRTGLCHRTLAGHTSGAVRALQFDEVQLISGGADCVLRFWDLRTGSCAGTVDVGARVNALHKEGNRVIVACADHLIKVYDTESKELVEEHGGHLGPVLSLAGFASTYVSGSTDQTAKLWDFDPAPS